MTIRRPPAPASRAFWAHPSLGAAYRSGLVAMILALLIVVPISLVARVPSPLEGVAERVMEWTPVGLATPLLLHLGGLAKPLALWGAYALLLVIGGLAAAVAPAGVWRRGAGEGTLRGALALTVLVLSLFVVMPPLAAWPVVVLVVLFVLLEQRGGALLAIPGARARVGPGGAIARLSRVEMLRDSALTVGGAVGLIGLVWLAGPFYRRLRLGTRGGSLFSWRPPGPRQAAFARTGGLTPEVTATPSFYVMSKNLDDPDLDLGEWSLDVRGHVARPFHVDAAGLLALPRHDQYVTLECVDNPVAGPLMSTALWSGVSLLDILTRAGVLPGARRVVFWGTDGHVDSVPLSLAQGEHALLAYGMNGAWLPRAHGYPLRALVPGLYGFKNVKWLQAIEVVDHGFVGHWQERGWTQSAIIRTTARIDVARVEAGRQFVVAGVAFAGARGIARVEVRLGGGPWRTAMLHIPPLSAMTWLQWQVRLPLPAGRAGSVVVEARAVDGHGHAQESASRPSFPNGPTGIHSVTVSL